MRFTVRDDDGRWPGVQPGDWFVGRVMVESVMVESVDVTALGGKHQVLPGSRTVTFVVEDLEPEVQG